MTDAARSLAQKFGPLFLLWLGLHAAVLAILVLAWGAAIVVRAVLAWFFHFALFVILAAGGLWLMARLWRSAGSRAT